MFSDGVSHQCLCSPLGLPVIDVGMCLEVNNKALRKEEIHSDLISVLLLALLGVCLSAPVHWRWLVLIYMWKQVATMGLPPFRFAKSRSTHLLFQGLLAVLLVMVFIWGFCHRTIVSCFMILSTFRTSLSLFARELTVYWAWKLCDNSSDVCNIDWPQCFWVCSENSCSTRWLFHMGYFAVGASTYVYKETSGNFNKLVLLSAAASVLL